ncbi:MAG: DUF2752 domain-containing protein [Muribaculaceae bacterium]|nr:DUF2752 domain-containing protein [Muribaculaceae bacterium]
MKYSKHLRPTAALIAAVLVLAIITLFYYHIDPSSGWMPRCAFKTITGFDCPGCGFQRALHSFLHGNIADAWHYNPFVFFAIPVATFYIIVEALRHHHPRLHAFALNPIVLSIILISIIIYWILRNI